jgi:magnesium transporter
VSRTAAPLPETAAGLADPDPPTARADETAGAVRRRLRGAGHGRWSLLCVLDGQGRLLGTLGGDELVALDADSPLGGAARRDRPTVRGRTDQEHMASIALHHGVAALPVLGDDGRLLGVVGPATLMHVLRREHVEDLHRLAGITRETAQARHALEAPPLRRLRHRLPWLLVGLLGSALATWLVSRFEGALAAQPALAFFIPALVYLADAIGTQTEAVAVRGLSLSRVGLARLFGGEMRTGLLIGLVLAALAWPLVWLAFGDLRLASTVTAALAASSVVASTLGLLLPWLLARAGTDPAYGSGPLATIVQDVLTLAIYFALAAAILP